jgi:hypothetical protein
MMAALKTTCGFKWKEKSVDVFLFCRRAPVFGLENRAVGHTMSGRGFARAHLCDDAPSPL